MTTHEIITGLRSLSQQGSQYRRTVCRLAAETIDAQEKKIRELEQKLQEVPGQQRMAEFTSCNH